MQYRPPNANTLRDNNVLQNSFQKSLLTSLETKQDVKITLQSSPENASICIEGATVDTSLAQAEVLNIFRQVELDDKDKTLAALYAKQVQIIFQGKTLFSRMNNRVNFEVLYPGPYEEYTGFRDLDLSFNFELTL